MTPGLLLDASVFIAIEAARSMDPVPDGETRVSVVTLTELQLGVLRAGDDDRAIREATLQAAQRFIALPVTEPVAAELARLLSLLRSSARRTKAFDCMVAATALAHDLTIVAQDTGFAELQAVEPRLHVTLV